jgi:programmed cell death 6-interacting protein
VLTMIESDLIKEAEKLEKEDPMRKVTDADFKHLFNKRLQVYDEESKFIIDQDKKQELLMKRIQDANTEFTEARKGDTTTKKREEALQSLSGAYYNYKEISNNLAAARRFYNDLIKTVTTFHAECEAFAHRRRTESSQLIRQALSLDS